MVIEEIDRDAPVAPQFGAYTSFAAHENRVLVCKTVDPGGADYAAASSR